MIPIENNLKIQLDYSLAPPEGLTLHRSKSEKTSELDKFFFRSGCTVEIKEFGKQNYTVITSFITISPKLIEEKSITHLNIEIESYDYENLEFGTIDFDKEFQKLFDLSRGALLSAVKDLDVTEDNYLPRMVSFNSRLRRFLNEACHYFHEEFIQEIKKNSRRNKMITFKEELTKATPNAAQFWRPVGTGTTVCALELDNGQVVVGTSHCLNLEEFDHVAGEAYALEDAVRKAEEFVSFRIRERGAM